MAEIVQNLKYYNSIAADKSLHASLAFEKWSARVRSCIVHYPLSEL